MVLDPPAPVVVTPLVVASTATPLTPPNLSGTPRKGSLSTPFPSAPRRGSVGNSQGPGTSPPNLSGAPRKGSVPTVPLTNLSQQPSLTVTGQPVHTHKREGSSSRSPSPRVVCFILSENPILHPNPIPIQSPNSNINPNCLTVFLGKSETGGKARRSCF